MPIGKPLMTSGTQLWCPTNGGFDHMLKRLNLFISSIFFCVVATSNLVFAYDEMRWNAAMVMFQDLASDSEFELAENLLQIALRQEPQGEIRAITLQNLSRIKLELGQSSQAVSIAKEAISTLEKTPDASDKAYNEAYRTLSIAQIASGDVNSAQASAQIAQSYIAKKSGNPATTGTGDFLHEATGLSCPKVVAELTLAQASIIQPNGSEAACTYQNIDRSVIVTAYLLDGWSITPKDHVSQSDAAIRMRLRNAKKEGYGKFKVSSSGAQSGYYSLYSDKGQQTVNSGVYVLALNDSQQVKFRVTYVKVSGGKNEKVAQSFMNAFNYDSSKVR